MNTLVKYSFLVLFLGLGGSLLAQQEKINALDANGKRHGVWKKYYANTTILRYEGTFAHGKEVGEFKFYKNHNGKAVLSAVKKFNANSDTARVIFYSSKGKVVSEGTMEGKKYVGTWNYYQNKNMNLLTKENYNSNGKLHGERIVYYSNGAISQKENFVNGKREGTTYLYTEDGVLLKEYNYKNGELHGPAKFYTSTGTLKQEGNYKEGKMHGVWNYYNNGKIVQEKDFTIHSKNPYKKQ